MSKITASLFRLTAAFAVVASASVCLHAQRLPGGAVPEHYTLTLAPDLKAATFTGKETIDVTLAQPMTSITLNAAEIDFKSVTADAGGKEATALVTMDKTKEQATLTFPAALPAGEVKLKIEYTGMLNDQLRGFYLSKTARRNYAVTQFEPTDARRAFPSFDEPALKATFDVTPGRRQGRHRHLQHKHRHRYSRWHRQACDPLRRYAEDVHLPGCVPGRRFSVHVW